MVHDELTAPLPKLIKINIEDPTNAANQQWHAYQKTGMLLNSNHRIVPDELSAPLPKLKDATLNSQPQ